MKENMLVAIAELFMYSFTFQYWVRSAWIQKFVTLSQKSFNLILFYFYYQKNKHYCTGPLLNAAHIMDYVCGL